MSRMSMVLMGIVCAIMIPFSTRSQDIDKVIIDIELRNVSLEQAFAKIESSSPFKFNYKTADIAGIKGIHYKQQKVSVKKVLTSLLAGLPLTYEQVQHNIIIKKVIHKSGHIATVYGFVTDGHSGENLIGVTVGITGDKTWYTVTNNYGFYSLKVPAGDYQFNCSYTGFRNYDTTIRVEQTTMRNIALAVNNNVNLQSVVITSSGRKNIINNTLTGHHRLNIMEVKRIPMAGGEPDVLKSLQFLPGIQTSNEGTTNISVRGGSYDQNLYLLDEAPVFNPTHTLGFFSVFNSEALKDVSIYKGVFPVQYGGRLSSVIDVRMKEGNNKERSYSGGIGLLASRFTVEGPLKKERSSFMVSGRYSNVGALLSVARNLHYIQNQASRVSFYDLNAKINPILGNKDRLYVSAYTGHDHFFLDLVDHSNAMTWSNTTVTTRWNHVFSPSLFANTSLLYSRYQSNNINLYNSQNFSWKSRMQEVTLKTDMDWSVNARNQIKWGAGVTFQQVMPGKKERDSNYVNSKAVALATRNSAQLFAYISNEQKLSKAISLSYGVRVTAFAQLGEALTYHYNADMTATIDSTWYPKGKIVQTYIRTEPRLTARILLSNRESLKLSYGRNYQFQHLLSNSSVGMPTDMWLPSDSYFKPQYSDQFALGYYTTFRNEAWEASIEGYYSKLQNVIDFKDNAEVFLNDKIETQILAGKAMGYGVEGMLKKNKGVSTGWISYTWSKAQRRIMGINNNNWYPPAYDHRHNLSIVYNYACSKKLNFSANWVFRSGGYTTVPTGAFVYNYARFLLYSTRNGYQLPAYHRLDVSATLQDRRNPQKRWQGEWVFSVYNAYARENVFSLYVAPDPDNTYFIKASETYLTSVLPTITYNFKF